MSSFSIKRWSLMLCGWLSMGLGIAGIILPLLPTTPFMLLAAACFYHSSPVLHQKMIEHPRFGPILTEWQESRTVKKEVKVKAACLIVVSLSISMFMLSRSGI